MSTNRGRIFCTGDTHGSYDIRKLNTEDFEELTGVAENELTREDYVIICGDFGLVWDTENSRDYAQQEYWLDWLNEKPYTVLFVDGNHENYDLLDAMPISEWHGGNVHFVRDNIIHLMRGQIYNIAGRVIFTMGGADSVDKYARTEGFSWWRHELPTKEECEFALENLERHNNKVDYIITHCAPDDFQDHLGFTAHTDHNILTNLLQVISETVDYKEWYMGHYHRNFSGRFWSKFEKLNILYNDIIEIE